MPFVYNEETGAESVEVYHSPAYKIDLEAGILPALFSELRFEANRPLSNADIDQLHDLIRYHWDDVVGGAPLDDIWVDSDNAYSTTALLESNGSTADECEHRGMNFIATLGTRIQMGTPVAKDGTQKIKGMPDLTVTVWADDVRKHVSV